jgi:HCOMODA/2-hydroxy-3-carboxy-muconic semialdehyde decarboxylase
MTDDDLRQKLVTANHILANEGIIQGFGHVSVRKPDSDEMFISRRRSPKFVEEDDIVKLGLDGTVLDEGDPDLYGETVLHRKIFQHRPDVNAIVHHHAPAVMPFTIVDTEIKPAFHMAALFADGVPEFNEYDTHYGRLIATEPEADRMAENLGTHRAQLLEGHGANNVGTSLEETIFATVFFVMNARYQYHAMQLGEPTYYDGPQDALDSIVDEVLLSPLSQERMWEYLKRSVPEDW